MARHAQLKFVITECLKTQIRLTGPNYTQLWFISETMNFMYLIVYFVKCNSWVWKNRIFSIGTVIFVCLCWGLTSQSTIFQSCRDGATASWVINQYFRGVKCLAQGHNTAAVGFEPPTSRSGVRHSTTEPPRSPYRDCETNIEFLNPYCVNVLCHCYNVCCMFLLVVYTMK